MKRSRITTCSSCRRERSRCSCPSPTFYTTDFPLAAGTLIDISIPPHATPFGGGDSGGGGASSSWDSSSGGDGGAD